MATFEAKKLELTQVNGGQEYEQGDFLQSDTINDVVEGTAYAQNVAEEANTKSNNAVSTANSANKTANDASTKVDDFDERITTAQNTADTAVSNAATAQSTADSATTEINKIKNGTTVVPNANHANNADNANLATKAQQDVNGNPINTTYATREFVAEQQGTRVKVNNVNVAELSFTSDPQTQITANKNAIAEAQTDINAIVNGTTSAGKSVKLTVSSNQQTPLPSSFEPNTVSCFYTNGQTLGLNEIGLGSALFAVTTIAARGTNYFVYQLATINDTNTVYGDLGRSFYRYGLGGTWHKWREIITVGASDRDYLYPVDFRGGLTSKGAPVFATDPSKLEPSTANGWTQTTATGTLPSAGVYLCDWTSGDARTGLSLLVFDGTNNALAVVPQIYDGEYTSQVLMYEANTENSRWTVRSGHSVAALSRVYYKRIA